MLKNANRMLGLFSLAALMIAPVTIRAEEKKQQTPLPDAVRKTFESHFPKAEIDKVAAEEENGVQVYDFEFHEGKAEKETDITADGTMIEVTFVITPKDVPKKALKPIDEAAKGATKGRTEKILITHELKEGKVIKLPKQLTHYAVEMKKGDEHAEIVVDAAGKVVEAPKWEGSKKKSA
jgi:hypothetical protein